MYDKFGSKEELTLKKISVISRDNHEVPIIIPDTLFLENIPKKIPKSKCKQMNEPVDAVYTWVNGSDPDFIKSLEKFQMNNVHKDMDNHRFEGLFSFEKILRLKW